MIQFNELGITSDNRKLIIDVQVRDLPYYSKIYIDSISIDTQDTYIDNGPSTKPIFSKVISGDNKSVRLELSTLEIGIKLDNLLFVYVKAKGIPESDTPCGMDNVVTIGVTFNNCPIYNNMMQYIKEIDKNCTIPKNFINLFLQYKALEISIETSHYRQAIKLFNKFYKSISVIETNICKCYE